MNSPAATSQTGLGGSPAGNAASPAHQNVRMGSAMLGTANGPSPASIFLQHGSQTPGALHAHLQQNAVAQPVLPGQTMSQAGSAISSSLATSADAPNEARKFIRLLLESEGQGRLSLARLQAEFQALSVDMYASDWIIHRSGNAFTQTPSADVVDRAEDLLATLEELQIQLAKTGLGALRADQTDFTNVPAAFGYMASSVQSDFKSRQRVRDGASVARSVLK